LTGSRRLAIILIGSLVPTGSQWGEAGVRQVSADGDEEPLEHTLVRLIVAGHGDRYIAAQLLVSPRTLYRLLERMMLRYDLPNRAALGAFAASQGWLPDFPPPRTGAPRQPARSGDLAASE
jgi:DNA-binding CsgD family transcriptional regulator